MPSEINRSIHRKCCLGDEWNARNQKVSRKNHRQLEAGLRQTGQWARQHKLQELIKLTLKDGQTVCERRQEAIEHHLELAGCYAIVTDVAAGGMDVQRVHDSYTGLPRVERDFRAMKTGAPAVRPIFVQRASRTRGHVFCCMLALKVVREIDQRLRAAFRTTAENPTPSPFPMLWRL